MGGTGELLSSAGDAIATAVVAGSTDLAIDGLAGFGLWTMFSKWLLSGGAIAVAVEVFFAIATIAIARGIIKTDIVEPEKSDILHEHINTVSLDTSQLNSIATEQIPIAQEENVSTELASKSFKTNDLSDFYSKTIPVKPLEAATPDLSDFYSKTIPVKPLSSIDD